MEDKTTPTLNEKILQVLRANEDNITEKNTAIDDFKFNDVANAIEKLLLQEQIYLLTSISLVDCGIYVGNKSVGEVALELTNKINTL